jgi:hypothetical protein
MKETECAKCKVYVRATAGYLDEVEDIDLPPRGMARLAAIYKYKPPGGSIIEIEENVIAFFDAKHCITRVIM